MLQVDYKPADLERDGDADAVLLGEADEGRDPLLAVLALGRHCAHVRPVHDLGDLHHRQRLHCQNYTLIYVVTVRSSGCCTKYVKLSNVFVCIRDLNKINLMWWLDFRLKPNFVTATAASKMLLTLKVFA